MARREDFYTVLARVLLTGDWTAAAMELRMRQALGPRRRLVWAAALCQSLSREFASPPGLLELRRALVRHVVLGEWRARLRKPLTVRLSDCGPAAMMPGLARFRDWGLPEITTPGRLAEWLGLTIAELEWFADATSSEQRRTAEPARNYRYVWLQRPGGRARLLESPKPRLKEVQRRVLHELLDRVPLHPAAHAFRRGHSVATCLTPHVGQAVVWQVDLRHFFPSLRRPRVAALFRMLGYPEGVTQLLAGLCTNAVPRGVVEAARGVLEAERFAEYGLILGTPHLPQGAPTSPALANLMAYRLDCRLAGLARDAGARYTRYADDLVFSGDAEFARSLPRFRVLALAIVLDEGFQIRERKVRTLPASQRQQVAGLVLNARLNIPRADYDALRATLYNCAKSGPDSQNREGHADFRAHLLGRISYVRSIPRQRSERLRELFERIEWGVE